MFVLLCYSRRRVLRSVVRVFSAGRSCVCVSWHRITRGPIACVAPSRLYLSASMRMMCAVRVLPEGKAGHMCSSKHTISTAKQGPLLASYHAAAARLAGWLAGWLAGFASHACDPLGQARL